VGEELSVGDTCECGWGFFVCECWVGWVCKCRC